MALSLEELEYALVCCIQDDCSKCPLFRAHTEDTCLNILLKNALSLVREYKFDHAQKVAHP